MVKSVRRKGVTLCLGWQVEEWNKGVNEGRRRSREGKGGREAWRVVSKADGKRFGNREEEAGNSEEELWDERRDCTWGEI